MTIAPEDPEAFPGDRPDIEPSSPGIDRPGADPTLDPGAEPLTDPDRS